MPGVRTSRRRRLGVNTAGVAAFTPLSLSPAMWLKADAIAGKFDGDAVASWADSSGNSRAVTQASGSLQPLYKTAIQNGLPVLRFDGADDVLLGGDLSALTGLTAMVVFKIVSDPPASAGSSGLWALGASGQNVHIPFTSGVIYDDAGSTTRQQTVDPGPSLATAFRIYTVTSAAGAWSSYLDGSQLFTTASNTVGVTSSMAIGANPGGGQYLAGDIGEFVLFGSALSTPNRQAVESYLRTKWGTA